MVDTKHDILIVDDDLSVRLSLSFLLGKGGYTPRLAENGLEALARIQEQVPHILLSDLNMPKMSGFELLALVRSRFPQIQVIAMSGEFSGTGIPPGVAADAFYEKGNSPRLLLTIVDTMRQSESPVLIHTPYPLASAWAPRNGKLFPGKLNATIFCPECRRTFSLTIGETTSELCETTCAYCGVSICYVSAPPLLREASRIFPRTPGIGIPSPLSMPDYQ